MRALPVFDCGALFGALDAQRRDHGLGWYELADELWRKSSDLNAQRTDHPLRLTMSYLAQARHVVDDTVRENLFAPDVDDADLLDALRAVGLTTRAGRGLLDRRATDLSGGEQQRLAVARILVDQSPMIIMDEPLAGVDAFTFADVRVRWPTSSGATARPCSSSVTVSPSPLTQTT